MRKKIKEIAKGWKNVIVKDEKVEAVAAERKKACAECPFRQLYENPILINMLGPDFCSLCSCPLLAKTRSLDSQCPDGRWPEP